MKKILSTPTFFFILLLSLSAFWMSACSKKTVHSGFSISLNDTPAHYQNKSLFTERLELSDYSIYNFKGSPNVAYGVSMYDKNITEGYVYFYKNKLCGFTLYFQGHYLEEFTKKLLEMPNTSWRKDETIEHKGPLTEVYLSEAHGIKAIIGQETTALIGGKFIGSFSIRLNCGSNGEKDIKLRPLFKYRGV